MVNRKRHPTQANQLSTLRKTDRAVLWYLNQLRKEDDTCTVSFPAIAVACSISERQAQISTSRLIEAELLKRISYDFGNIDRSRRGTKYRLLVAQADVNHELGGTDINSSIQEIITRQASIESSLRRLVLIPGIFPLYESSRASHRPSLRDIKRDVQRLKPDQRRKLAEWLRHNLMQEPN